MPRLARVVAVDVPHHITHRGNNRQQIFLSDEDRRRYQTLLHDQLEPCGIDLLGWCWMINHIHLVAVPRRPDALSRLIMRVHSRYAQEINRRYKRSGHLWQSRFFSCALDAAHAQAALLYVDRNPVRAGLTGDATAWPWSSASAHADGDDPAGLLNWNALESAGGCFDWEARLRDPVGDSISARLREATVQGRPCGADSFRKKLERNFGRSFAPKPRGRPPKARKKRAARV